MTASALERNCRALYLDLMMKSLTDLTHDNAGTVSLNGALFTLGLRENGYDWPQRAQTMIGLKRLLNLLECTQSVLEEGIPGDLMETGVWRGGACIFMRAILAGYADEARNVWVADSFAGLPPPDEALYPADRGDTLYTQAPLVVSLEEVKENFARYGLLDERVRFVKGWFRDTLPGCAVERLALLRLDGDMYESTYVALEALYPKLSVGGYLIVDDYGAVPACKTAVDNYRSANDIQDELQVIDWTGVFWKKSKQ